jgi:hypothetical protein
MIRALFTVWLSCSILVTTGVRVDDDLMPVTKAVDDENDDVDSDEKYNSIQPIGFSIYTWPKANQYIGNEDVTKDVDRRTHIMKEAIDSAMECSDLEQRHSVMKVFVAPEFFFRGARGAYSISIVEESKPFHGLLDSLEAMVSDEKWEDWLFIFGTITVGATDPKEPDETMFMNFAPIVKGGPGGKKFLAFKDAKSNIDFLNCTEHETVQGSNGQHKCDTVKHYTEIPGHAEEFLRTKGWEVVDYNYFTVDHIRFGVEICLDHAQHALQKSLEREELDPDGVQVQIITAAGMNIQYSAVPGGGPVILQDGGGTNFSNDVEAVKPPLSMVFPSWDFVKQNTAAQHPALGSNWRSLIDGYFDVSKYDDWHTPPMLNVYGKMKLKSLGSTRWKVGDKATRTEVVSTR